MSLGSHFRIRGTTPYYNLIRRLAFPSSYAIGFYLVAMSGFGTAVGYFLTRQTVASLLEGFTAGLLTFALPSFVVDVLLNRTLMMGDRLFYPRRILAFSLFCSGVWITVLLIAIPARIIAGDNILYPADPFLAGTFAVVIFRMLGSMALSEQSLPERATFALTQPAAVLAAGSALWNVPFPLAAGTLASAAVVGFSFSTLLLAHVEQRGLREIGFSPLRLFRAFLLDWLNGESRPLEAYLYQLGRDTEVTVTVIGFKDRDANRWKGVIVSPDIHPGPFLNVGSSALPFMIQGTLTRHLNCPVLVTHGVSGHELNLVSQEDNERVLAELFRLARLDKFDDKATPFVRAEFGVARASCQIFSKTALVTMTISPQDMEDIPLETGIAFRKQLNSVFENVALVDAHNCLSKPAFMTPEAISDLVGAAQSAVKQAANARRREFHVGFAQRALVDWKLIDGLGPAGVAVCAIKVDGEVAVYVSFDGNNMAPGFRERMLSRLKDELNIAVGEILTTDTHIVNGVTRARMGYRLVGDVHPEKLLSVAADVTKQAIANMSPARAGAATAAVRARTLGETSFREVTRLIHDISRTTALTLFPTAILVTLAAVVLLL